MKRLRLRIVLLIGWIGAVLGSQLVFEPIGMHRIIYAYIGVVIPILLLVPKSTRIPVWLVGLLSGAVFVTLKGMIGDLIDGTLAVYTITEVSFVLVSTILTQWVNQAIHEFETAVVEISIGNNEKVAEQIFAGYDSLYREVRRARNHQRPLALLAISVNDKTIQPAITKIMLEAQSTLMKQLVISTISKILCEKLEDCDIVVQDRNRFIVILPETTPDNIPYLVNRLQQQATEKIGIGLQIGTAALPTDSLTLEGLIDKAAHNLDLSTKEQVCPETEIININQLSR